MPTLLLRITPLHNAEQFSALGAALTALTVRVLHKRAEVTVVMIEDLPAARYLVGGIAARNAAACLEISITAGSNTAAQKAQFVSEADALLRRLLGDLHEASYVIVRELPASDWGYGGKTQAARRLGS